MPTFKQQIYGKWWKGNLVFGLGFLVTAGLVVFSGNAEYLVVLVLVIGLSQLMGNVKCPKCGSSLFVPSGPRAFEKVNYCQNCGFDLNCGILPEEE